MGQSEEIIEVVKTVSLELEILTPNQILAKETSVSEVVIPASWGQMGILPHHADFITDLIEGELSYKAGSNRRSHHITGGVIVVKKNKMTILLDGVMATVTPIDAARQ